MCTGNSDLRPKRERIRRRSWHEPTRLCFVLSAVRWVRLFRQPSARGADREDWCAASQTAIIIHNSHQISTGLERPTQFSSGRRTARGDTASLHRRPTQMKNRISTNQKDHVDLEVIQQITNTPWEEHSEKWREHRYCLHWILNTLHRITLINTFTMEMSLSWTHKNPFDLCTTRFL